MGGLGLLLLRFFAVTRGDDFALGDAFAARGEEGSFAARGEDFAFAVPARGDGDFGDFDLAGDFDDFGDFAARDITPLVCFAPPEGLGLLARAPPGGGLLDRDGVGEAFCLVRRILSAMIFSKNRKCTTLLQTSLPKVHLLNRLYLIQCTATQNKKDGSSKKTYI